MLLIAAVLGSMLFGIAAPTEAAALGALGALLLSVVYGDFSLTVLHESLLKTLKVTVMILTILMAGNMFAGVFIAGGGVQTTEQFIAGRQPRPVADARACSCSSASSPASSSTGSRSC